MYKKQRPCDCCVGQFLARNNWKKRIGLYTADIISIFNHCDVINMGLQATEFGEIMQNKGYYAVQVHSRSPYGSCVGGR